MSLRQKWYQANLSEFKEEVCRNPDADFTQYIQELAAKFIKRENEREKSNIHAMMLSLYEGDTQLLMRDITKVMMLGTAKAACSGASVRYYLCIQKRISPTSLQCARGLRRRTERKMTILS